MKYVSTTLINQNSIHEDIKSRIKAGDVSCTSVQNLLSASLLSKNTNMKIYRTIILMLFCMGVKFGLSHPGEECRLRVFENRVLRRIFGPKKDEASGEWRRLRNEKLYVLYCSPILFEWSNQEEWDGQGMWHVWKTGEVHTGIWWGDLRERCHMENLGVGGWNKHVFSRSWMGVMDWTVVAQDRDRWRALVNAVMNLRFPQYAASSLLRGDCIVWS